MKQGSIPKKTTFSGSSNKIVIQYSHDGPELINLNKLLKCFPWVFSCVGLAGNDTNGCLRNSGHLQCSTGKRGCRESKAESKTGLPWWLRGSRICLQCRRPRFKPWIRKIPLQKGMATHSSILAWKIPWTEEPSGLQSVGSQRVRQDWMTKEETGKNKKLNTRLTVYSLDVHGANNSLLSHWLS